MVVWKSSSSGSGSWMLELVSKTMVVLGPGRMAYYMSRGSNVGWLGGKGPDGWL